MSFDEFNRRFGKPDRNTAVSLEELGLSHSAPLKSFVSTIGAGSFADGLLSVASTREADNAVAPWAEFLPIADARHFATSALGMLFLLAGDTVWVVETQYGSVTESTTPLDEFFDLLAEDSVYEERLHASIVRRWTEMMGPIPSQHVLCPQPAIALGGAWHLDSLSSISLPTYLGFMAGLFSHSGDNAVIINRAPNDPHP